MPAYVELHSHSAFSFLDGASLPEDLAARAAELGYESMALTDHDGTWGSMEFAQAARSFDLRPITGVELTVLAPGTSLPAEQLRGNCPPGCFHLTLLAESATGYRNLCRLLTLAHAETRRRNDRSLLPPAASLEQLATHSEGLICLSGCARDGALGGRLAHGQRREAKVLGQRLLEIFGPDNFRVELQRPLWQGDRERNRALVQLAERLEVLAVATGNVHYHHRSRAPLQDALVATRLLGTLESTEPERRGNGAAFLASPKRMAERFREHPEAVAETERVAERCTFDLTRDLGYRYPGSEDPDADRNLREVCAARFDERYRGTPEYAEATKRLEEELQVIAGLRLSGFFLLHRDLLELAREVAVEVRGASAARALLPPGRGRGSSVSSVVCYLTGLSHVDPVKAGLFLGRFLNDEITEAPDIDLDFPRNIRERLIPRIHERYGSEYSGMVAAFPTYRKRGIVRDLGGALGLPAGEIERVARSADVFRGDGLEEEIAEAIGSARARSERWRALVRLAADAWRLPRHHSQHSGGMIISTRPLIDLCPVVPAAMEGRIVSQWDKDSCSDAGFLKIDLLGLGMLSAVERTVDEIARARETHIDLSRIPLDDDEVYSRIQKAETTGVFQIESRAQMQMLPRSVPENIDDLTVQVALVRPGPIQGGAVHPYLDRKKRLREDPSYEIPYEDPSLEPILSDTLGAIVFQDQVIQVAMALSGFSAGEAEGLRRAMSRKRSEEALNAYRDRFIEGAMSRGVAREVAELVYQQIKGFSGFGFPKSHAAAFGLLAYQSTWLRVYYGPEFVCSLLNEQPMGFYPSDALVHDAQRRGIPVLGPDVNRSEMLCRCEWTDREAGAPGPAGEEADKWVGTDGKRLGVRVGLGYVTGLAGRDAEAVVANRETGGPYAEIGELASRSGASREGLELLAWADACKDLGGSPVEIGSTRRREDLWRAGTAASATRHGEAEQLPLPLEVPEVPELAAQGGWERVTADYSSIGMAIDHHPMELMRPELAPETVTSADLSQIAGGTHLLIAGMVVARQRPGTAKGVMFLLLEDELGMTNVVVLPPVYERDRLTVRTAGFVSIPGKLERREGVVNIIAHRIHRLEQPDQPLAEVRDLSSQLRKGDPGSGRVPTDDRVAALSAVLPAIQNFGQRAR